jgi:hypothetical protein
VSEAGVAATAYRYENALKWLRMVAGLHYFGAAFEPEHMRELANVAADALAGRDIKDYDTAMAEGQERAREMAAALGFELTEEGKGQEA